MRNVAELQPNASLEPGRAGLGVCFVRWEMESLCGKGGAKQYKLWQQMANRSDMTLDIILSELVSTKTSDPFRITSQEGLSSQSVALPLTLTWLTCVQSAHLLCAHLLLLPYGAQSITITKLASLGGGTCLLNMVLVNEVATFDTFHIGISGVFQKGSSGREEEMKRHWGGFN